MAAVILTGSMTFFRFTLALYSLSPNCHKSGIQSDIRSKVSPLRSLGSVMYRTVKPIYKQPYIEVSVSGLLVVITTAIAYGIGCFQGYSYWGHRFNREIAKLLGLVI